MTGPAGDTAAVVRARRLLGRRDGWIEAANINGELAPGCSPMLRDGEQFPSIRYYAPAVRRLMAIVSEMGAL